MSIALLAQFQRLSRPFFFGTFLTLSFIAQSADPALGNAARTALAPLPHMNAGHVQLTSTNDRQAGANMGGIDTPPYYTQAEHDALEGRIRDEVIGAGQMIEKNFELVAKSIGGLKSRLDILEEYIKDNQDTVDTSLLTYLAGAIMIMAALLVVYQIVRSSDFDDAQILLTWLIRSVQPLEPTHEDKAYAALFDKICSLTIVEFFLNWLNNSRIHAHYMPIYQNQKELGCSPYVLLIFGVFISTSLGLEIAVLANFGDILGNRTGMWLDLSLFIIITAYYIALIKYAKHLFLMHRNQADELSYLVKFWQRIYDGGSIYVNGPNFYVPTDLFENQAKIVALVRELMAARDLQMTTLDDIDDQNGTETKA